MSAERSPELLTGELWQTMSPDPKVAFVWGIGNLVEFERAQAGAQPAGSKSFIDGYYETHPDQVKRPVVDAIFQAVVLPTLKAEKGVVSK